MSQTRRWHWNARFYLIKLAVPRRVRLLRSQTAANRSFASWTAWNSRLQTLAVVDRVSSLRKPTDVSREPSASSCSSASSSCPRLFIKSTLRSRHKPNCILKIFGRWVSASAVRLRSFARFSCGWFQTEQISELITSTQVLLQTSPWTFGRLERFL